MLRQIWKCVRPTDQMERDMQIEPFSGMVSLATTPLLRSVVPQNPTEATLRGQVKCG